MNEQNEQSVAELIAEVSAAFGTVHNPASYLAELMIGFDPRKRSSELYKMVKRIADSDEMPDEDEWLQIKNTVLHTDLYKRAPVSLTESTEAAKKLMDFLHAKKRSTQITGGDDVIQSVVAPLSEDEVDDFEEWFVTRF